MAGRSTAARSFLHRSWRRFLIAMLVIAVGAGLVPSAVADAQTNGLRIAEGRLVDALGNDIVLRGVNHPHAWFPNELGSLADIRAVGANAVRIVLSTGARFAATEAADLDMVVQQCVATRLICVLEVHDTTGFLDAPDAVSLEHAAQFWVTHASALVGHEAHVIINLGNEPFGNVASEKWIEATIDAVRDVRAVGLEHVLMVDAPNWGQDSASIMQENAPQVFDADPDRNLIFDVHMYGTFHDATKVRSYIESFVVRQLPLVIGEFGATHTDGDPDEDAIMEWAAAYGIGYLGWSWSGNTDPVAELNVVEAFDPGRLTSWGQRLISGENGLRSSSGLTPRPPLLVADLVERRAALHLVVHDRVEAEDGTVNGLGHSVKGSGFSGRGYVDGLDHAGDSVAVTVFVESADTYDLRIGYRARYGHKTQVLVINGHHVDDVRFLASGQFTSLTYQGAQLEAGNNTIQISHGWGWIDLDYIQVESNPDSPRS